METVEAQVRRIVPGHDAKVVIRRRPRGAEDAKAVAIDEFADLIWDARPVRVAAKDWCGVRNPDETLHVDEVVDALLTQLGLLLFHEQVERWNEAKVAWTSPAKTTEAIRWYIQGQRVGDRPIFNTMCARCGGWLYGHMNQSLGGGHKVSGEPRDVNDKPWPGTSQSQAESQPPFLLRHSPTFIAKMAPDVFEWDETTNRLTLTERHRGAPPWRIRKGTKAADSEKNSWLYCLPCHGTLFDSEPTPSVPFRDRASGARMRPDPKWEAAHPGRSPPRSPEEQEPRQRTQRRKQREQESKIGQQPRKCGRSIGRIGSASWSTMPAVRGEISDTGTSCPSRDRNFGKTRPTPRSGN